MYENVIADRMSRLGTESAFGILAEAQSLEAQGKSIIHMEIGQPDFNTPQNIIDAACKALNDGYTGYAPTPGYPILRQTIADYCKKYKHIDVTKEQVVVVPGGKPIMFYTMLLLVNKGDEVIYPNPGFPIYESCVNFVGGKAVPMPLLAKNNFKIDLELLEKSITDKTKLIIINNPSNPTGGVLTGEELEKIADILRKHPNVMILSDEIYDRLVYEGEPCSFASLPGMKDRTIILDGFSKTYAMTGWRLGYGVMPEELAKGVERLMVNSNSCTNSAAQIAGVEALTGPQDSVEVMKKAFKERRDYLVDALNKIPGITCCKPNGAFYVFPDISSFGLSCEEFYKRLMYDDVAGVACAWGTSFGSYGEGCIRLSYATSMENIKEAVKRIAALCEKLRAEKAAK